MKALFTLISLFFISNLCGQGTIFSDRYPDGIIFHSISRSRGFYYVRPISDTNYAIRVYEKRVKKIVYSESEIVQNKKYKPSDKGLVFPINASSGKIEFRNEFINENSLKTLSFMLLNNDTLNDRISLKKKSDNDSLSITFEGEFDAEIKHEIWKVRFRFLIKKKENGYEYIIDSLQTGYKTVGGQTTANYDHESGRFYKPIDRMYQGVDWGKNLESFWVRIAQSIEQLESILTNDTEESIRVEDQIILIHEVNTLKNGNQKSDKLNSNGFFCDFLVGPSLFNRIDHDLIQNSEQWGFYAIQKSEFMTSIGFKFGSRWYLNDANKRYNHGIKAIWLRASFGLAPEHFSMNLSLLNPGYHGTIKFNENNGLEIGFNAGLSVILWEMKTYKGYYAPVVVAGKATEALCVLFNPIIKYRNKKFEIGLDYSYSHQILDSKRYGNTMARQHFFNLSIGKFLGK